MLRTNRLTSALAGRGKAVAAAGAAAAVLAGAGAASAVTLSGTTAAAHAATTAAHTAKPAAHAAATAAPKPVAPAVKTAAKAAARTAKVAKPVAAKTAAAKPAAHKAAAKPAGPARPYQIYDSVTPSAIPAHHMIATYATGGYAVPAAQVAGRHVLWIDTRGTDPAAGALDVEPGDATPAMAATWAWHKLHAAAGSVAVIYTMRSEWAAAQAAVSHLPTTMQSHVRWWIADPTGVNHIVPGASATQWYWGHNYDITTAKPGF